MEANWVGAMLGLSVLCVGAWMATRHGVFLMAAAGAGFLMVPIAGTFSCEKGWPRKAMASYTVLLTLVGMGALVLYASPFPIAWFLAFWTFLIGAALSTWVASRLAMVRPTQ